MKKKLSLVLLFASPYALSVDYDAATEHISNSTVVACAASENQSLCDNPTSMCASLPKDTFETVKYSIRKAACSTGVKDPFEKPYADLLDRVADSHEKLGVLIAAGETAVLKKFGKTHSDVNTVIDKLKISLTKQAEADFDPKMAKRIATKLSNLQFRNAQNLLNSPWAVKTFTEMCGADGLIKNAFYNGEDNSLTICPGFLLNNLLQSGGELDNLSLVIGHEMGHALDASEFSEGSRFKTPEHFHTFLNCMNESFISDTDQKFGSNTATIEQLENIGIPSLKAEIEKVSKANPIDINYLSDLKRSLGTSDNQIKRFRYYRSLPDQLLSVKGELMADYQSAAAIRDQLQLLSQKDRPVRMKQMLSIYCKNYTDNEKRILALKWDGINPGSHPPETFRLENYFRSPEIRSLLACTPLKASDKPWCSVKGAVR